MTKHAPPQRNPGRWTVPAVIGWLTLASSILLENGQEAAAQWGSVTALAIIALLVLVAVARVGWIPLRAMGRRLRRRVREHHR